MKALLYSIQMIGNGLGMIKTRLARLNDDENIPKFMELSDWNWIE
jgi:hypothetical protein